MSAAFKTFLSAILVIISPIFAKADVKIQDGLGLSNYDLVIKLKDNQVYFGTCDNFGSRVCRPFGNEDGYPLKEVRKATMTNYYLYRGAAIGTGGIAVLGLGLLSSFGAISTGGILIDLAASNIGGAAIDAVIAAAVGGNLFLFRERLADLMEDTVNIFESTKSLKIAIEQQDDAIIAVSDFRIFIKDLNMILKIDK